MGALFFAMHPRSPYAASCQVRRVGLLIVGVGAVANALLACGPFLPEQILLGRRVALRTPVGEFVREVAALDGPNDAAPTLPPGVWQVAHPTQARNWGYDSEEERPASQLAVEMEEFGEILDRRSLPKNARDALLDQYKTYRAAVETRDPSSHNGAEDATTSFYAQASKTRDATAAAPARRPMVPVPLAAVLPGEWVDYLQGADCFHDGDLDGARQAWERLLARPQPERTDRSTWAAFMLARMREGGASPAENVARYQRVRELRAAGCRDGLNLAAASLGWEARLALDGNDLPTAARLYYLQARTGTLDGDSLEVVARAALGKKKGDPVLLASARDPFLRRVVTLYLACSREFADPAEEPPEAPPPSPAQTPAVPDQTAPDATAEPTREESARDWLAALKAAGVDNIHEAVTIAWAAYQQGDYAPAAEWLKLAPADEPLALWLRAKLALRAGKADEAARDFAGAVHAFPADPATDNEVDADTWRASNGRRFRPRQFQMDLGIVQLSRGDFTQAFASLLRSGFWTDAAYVAEQVLTVEELRRYVQDNFPTAPAVRKPEANDAREDEDFGSEQDKARAALSNGTNARFSADPVAFSLRYLLARRLARVGRYVEARGYYPAVLLPRFDEYVAARKLGETSTVPKPKRADAFWRAARIERWLGMELFGTEADPDWFVEGGSFQMEDYRPARLELPANPPPQPSPPPYVPPVGTEERRRLAKVETQPFTRYHYRDNAADLAWKAAALMPDGQENTATVLATGGRWLESVGATKAADRFYLAVLRRCGRTDLGREADKSGRLPDVAGDESIY